VQRGCGLRVEGQSFRYRPDGRSALSAQPRALRNFKIGSLALRISRVAQGALDAAFVGGNSHDWDLAAADLLVREAGGLLTTLRGDALMYNRVQVQHEVLLAAGRERHVALVAHLASH
jgi:myo-inositol-1(or 4)-monophosphatase